MNEIQLIRKQLATERAHLTAVGQAFADALQRATAQTLDSGSALTQFRQACVEYLGCVISWYQARDLRLERLAAALGSNDPRSSALNEILARSGASDEALAKLAAAGTNAAVWNEFVRYLSGPWSCRRDALELQLGNDARAVDWRLIGGIDADGILEERTRFARVASLLPAGASLAPATTRVA